jgi:DNA-binding NtrC family response regulator
MVDQGKFRQDLFFRLDVVSITLPPLRDREEDVVLLCHHFLKEFTQKNNKAISEFTPDALQILSAYAWPGNVRELRNVIERMVVLSRGPKLTARDLPASLRQAVQQDPTQGAWRGTGGLTGADSLESAERNLIQAALKRRQGNRTQAAAQLGISRRTLQRKLKQYRQENPGEKGEE